MYLYDQKYLYCENGFNVIYYFDANLYFQHHLFSLTWSFRNNPNMLICFNKYFLLLSILKSVVLPNNFCKKRIYFLLWIFLMNRKFKSIYLK